MIAKGVLLATRQPLRKPIAPTARPHSQRRRIALTALSGHQRVPPALPTAPPHQRNAPIAPTPLRAATKARARHRNVRIVLSARSARASRIGRRLAPRQRDQGRQQVPIVLSAQLAPKQHPTGRLVRAHQTVLPVLTDLNGPMFPPVAEVVELTAVIRLAAHAPMVIGRQLLLEPHPNAAAIAPTRLPVPGAKANEEAEVSAMAGKKAPRMTATLHSSRPNQSSNQNNAEHPLLRVVCF